MKSALLLLTLAVSCAFAAPFEIKEGDRVLLLGDALLERENTYGLLETRMHEQFPNVKFTVRNLSWSGETPKGWSRASFDGPEKGWERLKEQIAEVKPTVAILGFGMAASLQEMTDRSGDQTLNPDPVRYGAEPMSATRFKKELGELMDAISERTRDKQPARFILLSPIEHQDIRAANGTTTARPGAPDPASHNALLKNYTQAIQELAKERAASFASLKERWIDGPPLSTDNGIHLDERGYNLLWRHVLSPELGWGPLGNSQASSDATFEVKMNSKLRVKDSRNTPASALTTTILKKNELFFHQFRPANSTYLFGFRKHEQGRNAAEMPKFTPLIEAADAEIDRLKRQKAQSNPPQAEKAIATAVDNAKPEPSLPLPTFTVADGFELTLWADTNLVGKPVGMNWDAAGRLWVACSPVYPQITPGGHPDDKVVVLEDTDHDGKADKSTPFAANFVIAAGVAPDFGTSASNSAKPATSKIAPEPSPSPSITAAYVGASTELVRVDDTDGDGLGDHRRIVLSGFGTEDTHHTIHTLRWGPDGRLYFNQSIYIHSHMETPYGMVRLNSGGICAYDPRTERVEVFARGFINAWGHAWDKWGQSFATDGAGFEGINWIIPGAMYRTYEGARRIMPSISPGTYPKYCGLELIQSPLFPEDWQGNAITCDFRAHKITRFQINDLSQPTEPGKEALSGYVTKELPNPVVTTDSSFRPIDVKLGPDGALYIADWTNPIINHGEVDFRDPRRDHTNGRIWRLAPKGKEALKWETLVAKETRELLRNALTGDDQWKKEQSRRVLNSTVQDLLELNIGGMVPRHSATAPPPNDFIRFVVATAEDLLQLPKGEIPRFDGNNLEEIRAALDKVAGPHLAQVSRYQFEVQRSRWFGNAAAAEMRYKRDVELFGMYVRSKHPRVRVEAMRALATVPNAESVSLILQAALNVPGGAAKQVRSEDKGTNQFNQPTFSDTADPYYGYAAWLSINELDNVFLAALTEGKWKPDTAPKQQQLAWALGALRPEKSGKALSDFIAKNGLPKDGSGPWIELIGQAGGPAELRLILDGLLANTVPDGDNADPLADKSLAFTNPEANRRAAAALVVAAKRGVKPANPPYGGWQFHLYPPEEARNDVIRLAGLWKQDVSPVIVAQITRDAPKERLDAIFESLRTLATEKTATTLTAFLQPNLRQKIDDQMVNFGLDNNSPAIRRRALTTLASFRPDIALAALRGVLEESGSDPALWRELFSSEPFTKALLKKLPELTKEQATSALRAARELGKRGEKLVAAFTPLAGEAPVAPIAHDIAQLVDNTKKNGNPAEGELVYRRAALTCTVCHAIGGAGGKVGPDLSTIGASAPLDYIIESTVNPGAKVKEGFHAIAVTTKDGKTLSGTIAKETDTQLTLRDMTGAEQSVEKSNVKERTNIGSLMPAGLVNALNHREQANLFAFMAQLGKPGPFDASKAGIARTWRIYPGDQIEAVVANKPDPAKASIVHSLVDGRVTKDLLEVPLAIAGTSPTIVAAARFNTVSAGQTRLHLAGITKAWLDGAPLAIASDPNPVIDLQAGDHTLVIKLDTATLPAHFRAEAPEARFLTE